MLKIVSIVVAVPILIVGGLQGYLWYETREQAQKLTAVLAPFVTLTYRGVHASLLGSVGLNEVRLEPGGGSTDTFDIESVRLHSSDILSLYNAKSRFDAGKIPESMSISVTDLKISLYNDLLLQQETTLFFKPGASIGCGDVTYLGSEQLEEMGYRDIRLDFEVGYRFDQPNNRLNALLEYDIKEMVRLSADIGFAVDVPEASMLELQASSQLASFDFILEDESYHERMKTYCAEKSGDSPEGFVLNHIDLMAAQLRDQGLIVSEDLLNAYREFLLQPGQIKLSAEPDAPLNPVELQFYNPADIARLLGLKVEVNGRAVNDLSIAFAVPQELDDDVVDSDGKTPPAEQPNIEPADDDAAQTSLPPSAVVVVPAEPVVSKEFHPTPLSELYRHVGATAQIKLKNHREYKGKIQNVSGDTIQIVTRLRGGTATFSLTFDKIAEVGIFY